MEVVMTRVGWKLGHFSLILSSGVVLLAAMVSCSKPAPQSKSAPSQPSEINVEVRDGGPIVVTTKTAEFQILPSGFLQATLLKDGKRLTLDEPYVGSTGGSDSIMIAGKEFDFVPEFNQAKVLEARERWDAANEWRSRRVLWPPPGRPLSAL
jgi:hypothetical protein